MTALWCSVFVVLALMGCAGDTLHRQGIDLMTQGREEDALAKLEQAVREAPNNQVYLRAYRNARERILFRLLAQAQEERRASNFDAAEILYRRVLALHPGHAEGIDGLIAVDQGRRHAILLDEARSLIALNDLERADLRVSEVIEENPTHPDARALRQAIAEKSGREQMASPRLAQSFQKPVTLEFRDASLKQVLEALSAHSRLNFVLDRDVPPDLTVSAFLRDVSVEEALDLILTTNQLRRRVLNDTTLLIYPDSPPKVEEHQEMLVRNFFLANADAKHVLNMLQSMVKPKHAFADDKLNLLVVRDTPAVIGLVERLVATQDIAEPEVMLEVAVIEVTRSRLSALGIQYPSRLALSPLPSQGNTLTLRDLRNLNSSRIGATISPLVINLLDDSNESNLLANPRIRTHNKEKAQIRIGDRVPIVTTTATSTGFISENVQYVDVGLKLDVEPTVYPNDEISLKLLLEVSALGAQTKSAAGTVAYQISSRNANTVLRLKDGETQILGGLINDDDRKIANRFPGLSEFPLIGRLFSSENKNSQKTELVLSITPRLVRGLVPPALVPHEFWSGTENNPRLRGPAPPREPGKGTRLRVAPGAPQAGPAGVPQGPAGAEPPPAPAAPLPGTPAPSVPEVPAAPAPVPPPADAAPPGQAAPAGQAAPEQTPPPGQAAPAGQAAPPAAPPSQ